MSASMLDRPMVGGTAQDDGRMPAECLDGSDDDSEDTLGPRVGAGHVPPARAWQTTARPAHEVPATPRRRQPHGHQHTSALKTTPRRAFYRAWGKLPGWMQQLTMRIAARKVTLGACALIEDGNGRLLVAHHTYRRRAWGLPGGLSKRGEEPANGLARELREELGVAALIGPLIYAETESAGRHLTLYYRATLLGSPRVDDMEIDGVRFVALAAVPALFDVDGATATLPWLDALRAPRLAGATYVPIG